jgi:peptide/nickel transport system permease protein
MDTAPETGVHGSALPYPQFEVRRWRAQREFLRRFFTQPLGIAGLVTLLLLFTVAAFGPSIAPSDPYELGRERLASPSMEHLAGTDHLGRDVMSRVIYGVRPSLVVALGAILIGVTLGTLIGSISAYIGGAFDLVAQRVMDALSAFPSLFLGVLVLTVLRPSYVNLMIAIGIVTMPSAQRVVRASTLAVRDSDYVSAGRVIGANSPRLLFRHIFPNILSPILVIASAELGSAILIAASLSFLGFGTPPPEPSLGAMVSGEGRQYMQQAPWLVIYPAAVISIAILATNFLGDAVRDVLDPRLRF